MLTEELMGCADRLGVGEADEAKKVPSSLGHVRCGSLRQPLTAADKVQPIVCSLCTSVLAVRPVKMETSHLMFVSPVRITVLREIMCISVPRVL